MGSEQPAAPPPPPVDDLAERAARVRAMLARWAAETVTGEPDWSVESIEPMHLADDEPKQRT
jgi:hypothetical protein